MRKIRVFVSSKIRGLEQQRDITREVILSIGAQPIMAEYGDISSVVQNFAKKTPQDSCLLGVERSDIVIGILGVEYGNPQKSGLSATHEELRHAVRLGKRILIFKDTKELESRQQELVEEMSQWEKGRWIFKVSFDNLEKFKYTVYEKIKQVMGSKSS